MDPKTALSRIGWGAFLLAIVLALIGVVLIVGGLWLAVLGGSWYYVLAGAALLASGVYLYRGEATGAWIYIATFVVTVLWSFIESGLNGWALLPRIFAPFVLLVWLVAVLPSVMPGDGKTRRLQGFGGVAAFAVLMLLAIGLTNITKVEMAAPEAQNTFVYDDSAAAAGEWPTYGGGASAQRYSDLNQINLSNVKSLKVAWTYRTGGQNAKYAPETTPLKIGNVIYGCTGLDRMYALDAATGKQLWSHDVKIDPKNIPYTAACRGVSYYVVPNAAAGSICPARVFEGTLDGRIIAVDAKTGQSCSDFGKNGEVNITEGMGKVIPGMVAIDAAPAIVRGVVVTGHEVTDGNYRWAPSGVIQGYDAVTGKLRFAWDMMNPAIKDYPEAGQTYTPGTPNMWTTATGDEKLGLVYLPMGNSGADYYSSLRRPEEKKFSSALVALDVETGKPRWVFQTVHNDVWDYDLGSQVSLVDFPTANGKVPAIVLPSKTGEIYILDRATGQSLTPLKTVKAPGGGVEPSERATEQPVSSYATLRKADLKESDMWGMSPIDQMMCRIQFRSSHYKGFFTPPSVDKRWIDYPGYNGGSDWGSVAIDPRRGIIVANYNDMPNSAILLTREKANKDRIFPLGDPRHVDTTGEDKGAQAGVPYAVLVNAGWRGPVPGMLCKQPPYGAIRAIDLKSGKTIWDTPIGTARNNGPFGIPSMLPFKIGTPNNGGPAVTAGGLVFVAAATDNLIRAIDIKTGKTVWSDMLPAGGQATPMLYEQDGREYLVIMAGGHHFMETKQGDYLIAYALPK